MKKGHIGKLLALGATVTLISCITDGPNRAGAALIQEQNLQVERTLKSVTLNDFAIDSLWTQEGPEQPYSNRSRPTLWIGNQDGFSSSVRYGFRIESSPDYLDSLRLRITQPSITDEDELRAFNREDTSSAPTGLIVRSFAHVFSDEDIESAQIYFFQDADSAGRYAERLGNSGWFVSTLDTIQLDSAKVGDNLAVGSLRNLQDSLEAYGLTNLRASGESESRDTTFWIFTEVTLQDTSSTTNTMRRLGSDVRIEWRKPGDDDPKSEGLRGFKRRNSGLSVFMARGITSHPDYDPHTSDPILLTGLSQSVHFYLDRTKLLNALTQKDPDFTHSALTGDSTQPFDNTYFVPYAEISFPVDTAGVTQSGDYLIQFNLTPGIDTLYQDENNNFNVDVTLDANPISSGLIVKSQISEEVIDSISFRYYKEEDRYYFSVLYAEEQLDNDTVQVDTSKTFVYHHSSRDPSGVLFRMELILEPKNSGNALSVTPRTSITPIGSEALTEEKYYKPKSANLSVQITKGMQLLLNRNLSGEHKFYDFSLSSAFTSGRIEDLSDENDDYDNLLIPVFAKVPLKLDGTSLKTDITIHYYKQ